MTGRGIYQKGWSHDDLVFDELASRTTLDILEACGMSTMTTVAELDERDPRVVCLRCSFGASCDGERSMRVMGWREAVNHSVKIHFGNSVVKWECLSPMDTAEAKRLEAVEAAKEDYPTPATHRVWRCTGCMHHAHDQGRMTWAGLQAHFRQNPTHGNVDDMEAELNKRYFKDPDMTRRPLHRIKMVQGKKSPPTTPEYES
ncbi:hypothetical protein D9619_002336 [Psilocybe cf. subviscida]|uniref:Uncharacterized protein n=1 Tax=Psilocybe cf. subviscida TaxID=2480587 RepID=A0A8H5B062_9AGAR|nr:hypothetical protein D9619_002336 [Psilocybe cf. subviscida]